MSAPQSRTNRVLTKEEQERLNPDDVLSLLREGNARFVSGDVTHRDHRAQARHAVLGPMEA
jgi:carbonic anhydrase